MSTVAQAKGEYHYWNSQDKPLTVSGYGSTGWGYGKWRVADSTSGTKSWLDANMKYDNADNHKVYATLETWTNAGYCLEPEYTSCDAKYYFYASANTDHSSSADWTWKYTHTDVNPSADYARAHVLMKLDVPWRTDPSAGPTITAGTDY